MGKSNQPQTREAEFLRLLAAHDTQIAACVHSLIPLWNDAEDVLQETRTRLWEQFDDYAPGSNFAAWSRTVARFLVKAYYARKTRERITFRPEVVEAICQEFDAASGPPDEFVEALVGCVRQLNMPHQRLLHQHYTQGESLGKIAEGSGRSLTGLYSTFSRIRKQLLECVRRKLHAALDD